jgi:hypothetical protein
MMVAPLSYMDAMKPRSQALDVFLLFVALCYLPVRAQGQVDNLSQKGPV